MRCSRGQQLLQGGSGGCHLQLRAGVGSGLGCGACGKLRGCVPIAATAELNGLSQNTFVAWCYDMVGVVCSEQSCSSLVDGKMQPSHGMAMYPKSREAAAALLQPSKAIGTGTNCLDLTPDSVCTTPRAWQAAAAGGGPLQERCLLLQLLQGGTLQTVGGALHFQPATSSRSRGRRSVSRCSMSGGGHRDSRCGLPRSHNTAKRHLSTPSCRKHARAL
jgi:hypothetical protein